MLQNTRMTTTAQTLHNDHVDCSFILPIFLLQFLQQRSTNLLNHVHILFFDLQLCSYLGFCHIHSLLC